MSVRAVRGATTVENNDSSEILEETQKLLEEIIRRNGIDEENAASIIFTVTKDLDAAFPAVAARRMGWTSVALMCMTEIDVPGSLPKCIRIMLQFNTDKKNSDLNHIYLNEAIKLRPDLVKGQTKE